MPLSQSTFRGAEDCHPVSEMVILVLRRGATDPPEPLALTDIGAMVPLWPLGRWSARFLKAEGTWVFHWHSAATFKLCSSEVGKKDRWKDEGCLDMVDEEKVCHHICPSATSLVEYHTLMNKCVYR